MSAKNKPAKKPASKPAAKAAKPAVKTAEKRAGVFAKLFAKAIENDETSFVASDAPNAARHGFASHDRTDGKSQQSSKRVIFEHAVALLKSGKPCNAKALQAFAVAKKLRSMKSGKALKPSTIASWWSNWLQLSPVAFYPCDIERKSEINKLFAKAKK